MTKEEFMNNYSSEEELRGVGFSDNEIKKIMEFSEECYNSKYNNEELCTCKEIDCKEELCKGSCGCKFCHNSYMEFLSYID